jgi:hypothetical protein
MSGYTSLIATKNRWISATETSGEWNMALSKDETMGW